MTALTKKHLRAASLVAVNPFAGLVAGITHPRDRISRNLVWVFTIFYGTVFYIAETSSSDSVRYAAQLRMMHAPDFTFTDLVALFFVGGNSYQDIYQPLITFIVSRVTDGTWLLFGAFGILLGYVYSRNIWFLIDRVGRKRSFIIPFFLVAFALDVSIGVALNGVRMWTALHVFVFGFLHFSASRNPKYIVIAFLTPLIHFSFMLPCAMLLVFFVIRRFGVGIYVFFVATFLIASLDLAIVRTIIDYLPFTMEDRAMGYVDRAYPEEATGSGRATPVWFLALNKVLVSSFMLLASTWLFIRGAHRSGGAAGHIFLFGMLIYGATNLVAYVPSAIRFFNIGELLILAAVVLFLGSPETAKKIDRQVAISIAPLLTINIALGGRLLLEFASLYTLVGNFFIAPFVKANEGLYEIVRLFF